MEKIKNLKKLALLIVIVLGASTFCKSFINYNYHERGINEYPSGTGTITIEDVVYLAVDSGDPVDDINNVKVYTNAFKTNLVASFSGCGTYHCKYNLQTEGLSSGNYFVEATTESSYTFTGFVYYNP